MQIPLHGVEIQLLELFGVVERLAQRIGKAGILVQNLDVELVGPPVAVRSAARRVRDRTLACSIGFLVHYCFLVVSEICLLEGIVGRPVAKKVAGGVPRHSERARLPAQ
jgi:hypothetical protein